MILKYNLHNNQLRRISEESAQVAQDEMFISYNGPEFGESDGLLSEALTKHFKPKAWHFVKHNDLFENEGKTIGKFLKKKSRLPFY